jgi:hypothetical protein
LPGIDDFRPRRLGGQLRDVTLVDWVTKHDSQAAKIHRWR